jgi:hypothetical protein
MPQKLHLYMLILVSIFLLFIVSTLSATADNAKPVFVYAQSAATPDPLRSIAPEVIWQAADY